MFQTTCPNCDATLNAPDNVEGKRVKCKKCGDPFVARPVDDDDEPRRPSKPAAKKAARRDDEDDAPPRRSAKAGREEPSKPKKKGKRRPPPKQTPVLLFTLLAVGAVLLIGGAAGLYFFVLKDDASPTTTASGGGEGREKVDKSAFPNEFTTDGIVIHFPSVPTVRNDAINSPEGLRSVVNAHVATGQAFYAATVIGLPLTPLDQAAIEALADATVAEIPQKIPQGGTIDRTEKSTYGAFPSRNVFLTTSQGGKLMSRVVIGPRKIYVLTYGTMGGPLDEAHGRSFFNGLTIK